jgi:hypothetical protein
MSSRGGRLGGAPLMIPSYRRHLVQWRSTPCSVTLRCDDEPEKARGSCQPKTQSRSDPDAAIRTRVKMAPRSGRLRLTHDRRGDSATFSFPKLPKASFMCADKRTKRNTHVRRRSAGEARSAIARVLGNRQPAATPERKRRCSPSISPCRGVSRVAPRNVPGRT